VVLTCLGVTIAAGALFSMVAFALGMQARAEAPFEKLGLMKNIEVRPRMPGDQGHVLDDDALEQMASLSGVEMAYPDFRLRGVQVCSGGQAADGMAFGLPREAALFGLASELLVAGRWFTLGNDPQAILGERIIESLGFGSPDDAVGATVTLEAAGLSPEGEAGFTFRRKELSVTVVGVYSFPRMGGRFTPHGIILPVDLMKDIPGIRFSRAMERLRSGESGAGAGYEKAVVRVERPSDLLSVEKRIQQMGFNTHTLANELEEMRAYFVFLDVLLASVGTVALVVAGLGIVNTLVMSVLERYQEIGICKAIGASNGDLLVLFLTEASLIGLIGGIGGLGLGRLVSWLLEIGVNAYARGQGVTIHMTLFAFPSWLTAAVVLFSVVVAVLAGVYPALRAARVDPIRALRAE
jgi:putative ABC transport system permease protein